MSNEINGWSEKQEQIILAAQKRFGLYGMEKTSMQEIASDLGMTKGSIYYYFPDKEHLYLEVIKKEFNEFEKTILERIRDFTDPEEMMVEYVRVRVSLFQSFLNLSRFRLEGASGLKSVMQKFWIESTAKENKIISLIFSYGVEKKILKMEDPAEMSRLFLDVLKGLRMLSIRDKQFFYMEQNEIDQLVDKSVVFTGIFMHGLKAR
jgi:AcrR family transcriptional regulator